MGGYVWEGVMAHDAGEGVWEEREVFQINGGGVTGLTT